MTEPLPSNIVPDETNMRALQYFQVAKSHQSVWRWDEKATQIIWVDGSSIATRDEIVLALTRLSSRGLPPFGAVILLIAALRHKFLKLWWGGPTDDQVRNLRVPSLIKVAKFESYEHQRVFLFSEPKTLSRVVNCLNQLSISLPRNFPKNFEAIASVVELVLAGIPDPVSSEGAITMLANGMLDPKHLNRRGGKYTTTLEDLAVFAPRLELLANAEAIRDCLDRNYSQSTQSSDKSNPVTPGCKISVVQELQLPNDTDWIELMTFEWGFCVAGRRLNGTAPELLLARYSWAGKNQILVWPEIGYDTDLSIGMVGRDWIVMHRAHESPLAQQIFAASKSNGLPKMRAGGAPWFPERALGMAAHGRSIWFAQHYSDPDSRKSGLLLQHYDPELRKQSLACTFECGAFIQAVPMRVAGSYHVAVGVNKQLFICWFRGAMNYFNVPGKIGRVVAFEAGASWPITACMEKGVAFHWLGADKTEVLFEEHANPVAGFTKNGVLVVVSGHEGWLCEPAHSIASVTHRSFHWPGTAPKGIGPTGRDNEFAVLTSNRSVQICINT
jgi:hypothetical protein